MPLTIDSIIRQNSGGVAAATSGAAVTVSLSGGDQTETGNTLVVVLAGGNGQSFSSTPPSGWANLDGVLNVGDASMRIYLRGPTQGLAAGESSWDFTPVSATAGPVRWTVWEIEGVLSGAANDIMDAESGTPSGTASGTTAVDTTGLTSTYDGLAISVHVSYNPSGTDNWSSHTDGFIEVVEGSQVGSGSNNVTLSVSARSVNQVGTYGATATCSRTLTSSNVGLAWTVVLDAATARHAADLRLIDGAEHGVITGNTLGPANYKIAESATAGVSISSSAARSGGFGWLYSSSSAACNSVHYNGTTLLGLSATAGRFTVRLHFRLPTLPGADAELWVLRDIGAAALITVRFIDSSDKIGLKVGSGTEQVSDTTITANQWVGVDIGADLSTTAHKVDWRVDYNAELTDTTASVAQTQATATGTANPTLGSIRRGWTTSITATMHADDFVASGELSHYPIGDVRVLPLKVDPAGTPTISGTSTNFGVMTNNGTVNAWNATNARNAIDDVPPDLSGTRDAAVCLLAHASDYAEFPMETYDMAANQMNVRGVAWKSSLWAASATTATIRTRIYDGVSEVSGAGYPEADPGADNAATPVWISGMARPTTGRIDWTQTKIDALTYRIGSNDATPDIGIDTVVFELAVVKTQPEVLFGSPGDPVYVEAARDLDTQGLVGFTVTTVGAPATVDYEVDGTPDSTGSIAADTSHYEAIATGGEAFPKVNKITLIPG